MKSCLLILATLICFSLAAHDNHDHLAWEFFNLCYSDSLVHAEIDSVVVPVLWDNIRNYYLPYAQSELMYFKWEEEESNKRLTSLESSITPEMIRVFCMPVIKDYYQEDELAEINSFLSLSSGKKFVSNELTSKSSSLSLGLEMYIKHLNGRIRYPNIDNDVVSFVGEQKRSNSFPLYDNAPVPLSRIMPGYPSFYMRAKVEGTVILEVEVRKDGNVGEIIVRKTALGYMGGFEAPAISAVRNTQFLPGMYKGEIVDCMVYIPVEFKLK